MIASHVSESRTAIRVLIVEDNKDTADSLSFLLKNWGYDVRVAHDGVTGMEIAKKYRPDCLLSDIGLPRMDGYLLAKKLRSQASPPLKLIAVTAYGDEQHLRRAKQAGFEHYLVKPVNPVDLEQVLAKIVAGECHNVYDRYAADVR